MTILPTLDGGLAIQPESDTDWSVLEMIAEDIGRPGHLAESLGGLMDDESEWDAWVVPDLVERFEAQNNFIVAAIQKGRRQSPPVLSVTPNNVESWYGAVNQARLALQARYQLDTLKSLDDIPEEMMDAYYRDRFYTTLLSLFIEYVME